MVLLLVEKIGEVRIGISMKIIVIQVQAASVMIEDVILEGEEDVVKEGGVDDQTFVRKFSVMLLAIMVIDQHHAIT